MKFPCGRNQGKAIHGPQEQRCDRPQWQPSHDVALEIKHGSHEIFPHELEKYRLPQSEVAGILAMHHQGYNLPPQTLARTTQLIVGGFNLA